MDIRVSIPYSCIILLIHGHNFMDQECPQNQRKLMNRFDHFTVIKLHSYTQQSSPVYGSYSARKLFLLSNHECKIFQSEDYCPYSQLTLLLHNPGRMGSPLSYNSSGSPVNVNESRYSNLSDACLRISLVTQ